MEESDVTADCARAAFVALLKDFPVVLNKSLLPKIASDKEKAWKCLAEQFSNNVGKQTSVAQMKKLLNNMKSAVKKKSDLNATGNKPIKLLPWETDFLKISEASENPVYSKIPGALCVGLGTSVSSPDKNDGNYDEGAEDEPDDMVVLQQTATESKSDTAKLKKHKKLKLLAETEETSKLTTGELQRLLLLEQIKLTRLQSQSEEMRIKELKKREEKNKQIESYNTESVVVVEENNVLKEFLVLK